MFKCYEKEKKQIALDLSKSTKTSSVFESKVPSFKQGDSLLKQQIDILNAKVESLGERLKGEIFSLNQKNNTLKQSLQNEKNQRVWETESLRQENKILKQTLENEGKQRIEERNEMKNEIGTLKQLIKSLNVNTSPISAHDSSNTLDNIKSENEVKLMEKIGKGGFSVVYKAYHLSLGIIAIKCMPFSANKNVLNDVMTQKEIKVLKMLRSPYLVMFHGAFLSNSQQEYMIAMELMNQGSLDGMLYKNKTKLDDVQKKRILLDIAKGIEVIHSNNPVIIHRDLKSMNILLTKTEDGTLHAKIADFGTAKFKKIISSSNSISSKTTVGAIGSESGTLFWMAPERFNGSEDKITEKVDIYSFAIIMTEVWTGKRPYHDKMFNNEMEFKFAVSSGHLRPEIGPNVPMEMEVLIRKCWDANPSNRPSASQIVKHLEYLLKNQ